MQDERARGKCRARGEGKEEEGGGGRDRAKVRTLVVLVLVLLMLPVVAVRVLVRARALRAAAGAAGTARVALGLRRAAAMIAHGKGFQEQESDLLTQWSRRGRARKGDEGRTKKTRFVSLSAPERLNELASSFVYSKSKCPTRRR